MTIEDRLRKMIVDRLFLRVDPSSISEDDDLEKKFDVDSPKIMEMVVGIEEEFGIQVGDEEFKADKFKTLRKIASFVRARGG